MGTTKIIEDNPVLAWGWTADKDGRLMSLDAGFANLLGRTQDDLIRHGWFDRVPEAERNTVASAWNESLSSGKAWSIRYRLLDSDGRTREVLTKGVPHADGNWEGVTLELSNLREPIQSVYQILESMSDAFVGVDRSWKFSYLNPRAEQLLKVSHGELVGKDVWASFPDAKGTAFESELGRAMAENQVVEFEAFYPPLETLFQLSAYPTADGLGIYFRDVTHQRKTEEDLVSSQQGLELAVEAAQVGIWSWDLEKDVLNWSPRVKEHFGLTPASHIDYQVFLDRLHPADRSKTDAAVRAAIEGGTEFDVQYRVVRPDGEERWIEARGRAYRNNAGKTVRFIGVTLDMTARKEAEEYIYRLNQVLEKRVEERTAELVAANKELEGFTYSVSHDLRAPLRSIMTSSMILMEDYADQLNEDAKDQILRQAAAAKKLNKLIDDILQFSRLGRSELTKEAVDMSALAQEVAEDLRSRYHSQNPEYIVQPELNAHADPKLIRFVLENLLENATKFQPKSGQPRIEFAATIANGSPALMVRDNGIGFSNEYGEKIFLPFERLVRESDYSGTGIGLANVKRIIERHGGRVWVESAPDEGTTFYFELPPSEEAM